MRTRIFEAGMVRLPFFAAFALRIRVSMSAMASVLMSLVSSPGRLAHAGDLAAQGARAQADAADPELPVHGARAPAQPAAPHASGHELRLALRLDDQAGLGHRSLRLTRAERHAEPL